MTKDKTKFLFLTPINGGKDTFGKNAQGKVIDKVRVSKFPNLCIDGVLFVKGLEHNLHSISQFCSKGYMVMFNVNQCLAININHKQIKLIGKKSY